MRRRARDAESDFIKTRLPRAPQLGYQACVGGHVAAVFNAETTAENDTRSIELKPQFGEI